MPKEGYYLPSRRLVSQDDAAVIESANVPRSRFVGEWTRKTAFDASWLVPIMVDEIYPGDNVRYNVEAYVRMSTPLFPLFDMQKVETFFFFVPMRLVWDNWVKMMGEVSTSDSPDNYVVPMCDSPTGGYNVGSLQDHMGLPVEGQIDGAQQLRHNNLPMRAYNLIYNDWFRDQNLIDPITVDTDNGLDDPADYLLTRRAKAHDYFTSCLPWPQKFDSPVVALSGMAPVLGIGRTANSPNVSTVNNVRQSDGSSVTWNEWYAFNSANSIMLASAPSDAYPAVFADLAQTSGLGGIGIEQLRQAFMVQSLLERDARGGTRYIEILRAHFGVKSPDARLQRPEYIGGGRSTIGITPIAQSTPTATEPLGALGATGTATGQHSASYAATEHGYIIGIVNVRSELSYQQGFHRMWWPNRTRYDFYWPALAQLGEQAVLRKELFCTGVAASDDFVFGYQERWHELRVRTSEVTGVMRSTATGSIDQWHLSQELAAGVELNQAFIEDTPPMDRVLAAGSSAENQQYLADFVFRRDLTRALPVYGTPAFLGRF